MTHQQLINFLSEHAGHPLMFEDSVENETMLDMVDDNDRYPDEPIKP